MTSSQIPTGVYPELRREAGMTQWASAGMTCAAKPNDMFVLMDTSI